MAKKSYSFVVSNGPHYLLPTEGYVLQFGSYEEAKRYEHNINLVTQAMGFDQIITLLGETGTYHPDPESNITWIEPT